MAALNWMTRSTEAAQPGAETEYTITEGPLGFWALVHKGSGEGARSYEVGTYGSRAEAEAGCQADWDQWAGTVPTK
jgi:hypothetical protein